MVSIGRDAKEANIRKPTGVANTRPNFLGHVGGLLMFRGEESKRASLSPKMSC